MNTVEVLERAETLGRAHSQKLATRRQNLRTHR
jgi:hypothetical protein